MTTSYTEARYNEVMVTLEAREALIKYATTALGAGDVNQVRAVCALIEGMSNLIPDPTDSRYDGWRLRHIAAAEASENLWYTIVDTD